MKKQLFLHVGMGKTGTTALQEFFWANRDALADVGVAYPAIGVEAGAHHRLSAHVPPELASTDWNFLTPDQWIEKVLACSQDRILISSELNSWATREEVSVFIDALEPHFDLQIVYYLRRPDNYVMADYNQQVKAGIETRTLPEALEEFTRRADFPRKIGFWADRLGESAMHLRLYERGAFKSGDIITDFLEVVLGIKDEGFVRIKGGNSNPRLSPEVLSYKRLINSALPDMRDSGHFIGALAAYAMAQDADTLGIYQDQALLDWSARKAILDRYADGMADVARRYFGREDGVLFTEPLVAKPTAAIRPIESLAAEISVWLAAKHPVEYAFLRAQVADVWNGKAERGDIAAAKILALSFKGDAPVVSKGLLVPARKWDALRAEFEAERTAAARDYLAQIADLAAGLASAETARDELLAQIGDLTAESERMAKDNDAELAAQVKAYTKEIDALKLGLAGADETCVSLRQQVADLHTEQARIVKAFEAEADQVGKEFSARIAANQAEFERYAAESAANQAALAKYAAESAANQAALAKYAAEIEANEAALAKYVAESAANEAALAKYVAESEANEAALAKYAAESEANEAALAKYVAESEANQAALEKYAAENEANQAELEKYAAEIAGYNAEVDGYIAAIEGYVAKIEDYAHKGDVSEAQSAKQKSDIEFYANEVSVSRHNAKMMKIERDELAKDLEERTEELRYLNAREAELLASTSWRITAPLRRLSMSVRRIGSLPQAGWLSVNRAAQRSYRGLARRYPKLAGLLKRMLWPLLMAGNRMFLNTNHIPMNLQERAIKGPVTRLEFQRPRATQDYAPLVSIIVPNYNHAPYLAQRLESIYAQTYANVEVLLMDDCSTDDSRTVLQGFADRYPERTRILFNETNSGGVFFQWEKGLREAKGDLIWIAESDDWASDNFLETLVPFFENQAVQLAYAPTVFMNGTGDEQIWSMDHCLAGLNPERWHQPFVETAPRIVAHAFGERNIVPNVSSAMFRKVDRLDVLENDLWRKMRTCGDWLFYINLIRGGCIAFSPDATNYYRLHDKNTSRTSYAKDSFYQEHEIIAKALQRHYDVPWDVFERQDAALRDHWQRNRPDWNEAEFEACYSLDRIQSERAARMPNLLMVGFAFCAGGGETFPIQLANLMKTSGYNVTFLDCAQEAEVPGVRAMLARDIPVVSNFEGLSNIAEAFDIDVIHSHHAWVDNTILDLLPEDAKAKTVVSLHGMYETIPDGDLARILPRLVARTGKLIYTAEKNLGALLAHGLVQQGEVDRIDNALDRRPVTPIDRADLGISEEAFVLTLVARALEEKGWLEAVEAVARARALSGADIHLILIGEGPAYDKLKAKGVPDCVHLLGFKSNIRDYFAASNMGFLPSRFRGESFPLVLIDCLNAGRPVLASTVGEIRYMLETEDGPAGALFDLTDWKIDVAALAAQIADLATDPALMARLQGRVEAAAARFDPVLMRDRYDAAYHAATGGEQYAGELEDDGDV